MDEIDRRMREVLLELAMTSNGSTTSFEASTSGGYYTDVNLVGSALGDAPHVWLARDYDAADSNARRRQLLAQATDVLKHIRYSIADPSKEETRADRDARIVSDGEGMSAKRCAVWARCGEQDVRKARDEAGRETEFGRRPRNGRALTRAERLVAIVELVEVEGLTMRDAARALDLSYNTVRRALGRSA